jgi:phage terminase large subunit-like protein
VRPGAQAFVIERAPGKYERLWRARHERDIELCRQPGGHPKGYRFDAGVGGRAVQFVERYCKHHKGEWAGKPLLLTELQREIFTQIFGWLRRDGTRRFRTAYVEVPRKFGKSTVAGGIGLYLVVADGEQGAEVYSSATKKDQAAICWKDAVAMVKGSAELKRFVKTQRNNISCERMGSKFEPLGADSSTLDGLNPHGNIIDELHAHKDRGVWDVLETAMGARRQPLTLAITTAGKFDPESIGWQIHDYATKVLEGIIEDERFFAFIAAADEPPAGQPDYYFTEAAWRQANPGFGVSPKADFIAEMAQKAKDQPSFYNAFLQLHLNVWTQQATRWLQLERWAECEPAPAVDAAAVRAAAVAREVSLEGKPCFGGLDLSSKLDLSALVLAFPGADDAVDLVCRFWLPEATVEKYLKKGQRHYDGWQREGWLTVTPGDVIDYEFIRAEVLTLSRRFKLRELAFDPWGATDLSNRLGAEGIVMVETRQGYKTLSEPAKDLEARVVGRKVRHANNPMLRFCAANAVVTRDPAGNIKPDKEKATDRIDGIVATVMALSRVVAHKTQASPYETRGLLML